MSEAEIVGLGCLGGALPDLLRLLKLRHEPLPDYLRRWFFWISLLLLIALGGVVTHYVHPEKAIEAISVGFGAPAILSKLFGHDGDDDGGGPGLRARMHLPSEGLIESLRRWWAR